MAYAVDAFVSHFCSVGAFCDIGDIVVSFLKGVSGDDVPKIHAQQDVAGCFLQCVA